MRRAAAIFGGNYEGSEIKISATNDKLDDTEIKYIGSVCRRVLYAEIRGRVVREGGEIVRAESRKQKVVEPNFGFVQVDARQTQSWLRVSLALLQLTHRLPPSSRSRSALSIFLLPKALSPSLFLSLSDL